MKEFCRAFWSSMKIRGEVNRYTTVEQQKNKPKTDTF